jgi:hypothetical protein
MRGSNVDALVADAVARSRDGSIFTRTFERRCAGRPCTPTSPARVQFSSGAVRRLNASGRRDARPPAIDATLEPTATGNRADREPRRGSARGHPAPPRRALLAALVRPDGARTVHAKVRTVVPKTTSSDLVHKYPSYIIIDRAGVHPCASNSRPAAGSDVSDRGRPRRARDAPPRLYDVQWKQTNPSWYVPNSRVGGRPRGKVNIPPGPDEPHQGALDGLQRRRGIHGIDPSEYGSIGHNASHGCVRMRNPGRDRDCTTRDAQVQATPVVRGP